MIPILWLRLLSFGPVSSICVDSCTDTLEASVFIEGQAVKSGAYSSSSDYAADVEAPARVADGPVLGVEDNCWHETVEICGTVELIRCAAFGSGVLH